MTQTELIHRKIMQKYNKVGLIKEDKIKAKKQSLIAESKKPKKEKEQELFEEKTIKQSETTPTKELDQNEKDFINAYIQYNELTFLNKATSEITKNFIKALGENSDVAIKELDNKVKQRSEKIKQLTKKLSDIKEQVMKETEKVKYKESLVSLFDISDSEVSTSPKDVQAKVKAKSVSKDLVMPNNIVETKK